MANIMNKFGLKKEKVFSKKEICNFYEELEDTTPRNIYDLDYGGEFNLHGESKEGVHRRFYDLGKGIGGRTIKLFGIAGIQNHQFERLRINYINQKLAEKLNLSVPEIYGFKIYEDKFQNVLLPMIEMKNYERKTIEEEFGLFDDDVPRVILRKFSEKEREVFRYLKSWTCPDIGIHNAIWLPEKEDVVLIDTDDWDFKGVDYKCEI